MSKNDARSKKIGEYQLGDCIGKGAFGSVFRALSLKTGQVVAVKQVNLEGFPTKKEAEAAKKEIDLLSNLNHVNIVKYLDFEEDENSLNIILEYCEGGSLQSVLQKFGQFPEPLVGVYTVQILKGLRYLHHQGVIHRDIKAANLLSTKDGKVKLADFGVARFQEGHGTVVGSPYWIAPEVIQLNGSTAASDIWSLGCTIIQLITGKAPYQEISAMAALFRIVQDEHPPLPSSISPMLRHFLKQCFVRNPSKRPSAAMLLHHPWIQSYSVNIDQDSEKDREFENDIAIVREWSNALKNLSSQSVAQYPSHEGTTRERHSSVFYADAPSNNIPWALRNKERHLSMTSENDTGDSGSDLVSPPLSPSSSRSYSLGFYGENEQPPLSYRQQQQQQQQQQSASNSIDAMFQEQLHVTRQRSMTTPSTPTSYPLISTESRTGNRYSVSSNTSGLGSSAMGDNIREGRLIQRASLGVAHDNRRSFTSQASSCNSPELTSRKCSYDYFPSTSTPVIRESQIGSGYQGSSQSQHPQQQQQQQQHQYGHLSSAIPAPISPSIPGLSRLYNDKETREKLRQESLKRWSDGVQDLLVRLGREKDPQITMELCGSVYKRLKECSGVPSSFVQWQLRPIIIAFKNHKENYDVLRGLLTMSNRLVRLHQSLLQSFCINGAIPLVFSLVRGNEGLENLDLRSEALYFLRHLCRSSNAAVIQMVLACDGLRNLSWVLVDITNSYDTVLLNILRMALDALTAFLSSKALLSLLSPSDISSSLLEPNVPDTLGMLFSILGTECLNLTATSQTGRSDFHVALRDAANLLLCISSLDVSVLEQLASIRLLEALFRFLPSFPEQTVLVILHSIRRLSKHPSIVNQLDQGGVLRSVAELIQVTGLHTSGTANKRVSSKAYQDHIVAIIARLCQASPERQLKFVRNQIIFSFVIGCAYKGELPSTQQNARRTLLQLPQLGCEACDALDRYDVFNLFILMMRKPAWCSGVMEALCEWARVDSDSIEPHLISSQTWDAILTTLAQLPSSSPSLEAVAENTHKLLELMPSMACMVAYDHTMPTTLGHLTNRLTAPHSQLPNPAARLGILRILLVLLTYSSQTKPVVEVIESLRRLREVLVHMSETDPAVIIRNTCLDVLALIY
ncbi:Protein kinase of the Mitotic Exit Network [Mycoemilia scoparia]|uniref:Protein kinase of the Mitotic Exit Network n=1 Tax=Mycoemilia scoparia TaxID=417184 RepID=A0A9W8DNB7_9FUNG|nr:Protein kinase of the Mitotic Exit Network [Mycoemilia scoparia]